MDKNTESIQRGIIVFGVIKLIRLYQFLTPWLNCCRFEPSCSEYSIKAIKMHGIILGTFLTLWRLARCQPYCKAGYDPVPEKIKFNIFKKKKLEHNNV
jgi:putative membrane protein insertion efficiency factor